MSLANKTDSMYIHVIEASDPIPPRSSKRLLGKPPEKVRCARLCGRQRRRSSGVGPWKGEDCEGQVGAHDRRDRHWVEPQMGGDTRRRGAWPTAIPRFPKLSE